MRNPDRIRVTSVMAEKCGENAESFSWTNEELAKQIAVTRIVDAYLRARRPKFYLASIVVSRELEELHNFAEARG